MPTEERDRVEAFLEDFRAFRTSQHALMAEIRRIVETVAPDATAKVMYGGIVFERPALFCGVFAYTHHVSVEFSRGCDLDDPHNVLEGKGKFRRHIKLHGWPDIAAKHVADYIAAAAVLPSGDD